MTILIADDNALIRSWLKIILQQLEGKELQVLEANDGEEALALCLKHPVDLLITDIKMPGMDGISLIKTLLPQRPDVCCAVLSSYGDFEYVRVALKHGALDYILKAEMQQEDISSLLEKVRETKALSNSKESHLTQYQEAIQKAQAAYDTFIREQDASASALLNLCLPAGASKGSLTVLVIRDHTASVNVASICCSTLKMEGHSGLAFPLDSETFLMVYSLDDAVPQQKEQHLRLLAALDQNLTAAQLGRLQHNVNVTFQRNEDFSQKLHLARRLVEHQIYYNVSELPEEEPAAYRTMERTLLENLQTMLNIPNYNRVCTLLQNYVSDHHSIHARPHRIRRTVTAAMQMMLAALNIDSRQSEPYLRLDRLIQETNSAQTAKQLHSRVELFCNFYVQCASESHHVSSPAIIRAMAYCNEHYAGKLTLNELADLVRLNKSYFSQLFHKEVGMPFSDYVESVRICHAQQYLRKSNYSMAEIAELVGFANQNYFTKVFKKVTGFTPSQYRISLLERKPD